MPARAKTRNTYPKTHRLTTARLTIQPAGAGRRRGPCAQLADFGICAIMRAEIDLLPCRTVKGRLAVSWQFKSDVPYDGTDQHNRDRAHEPPS